MEDAALHCGVNEKAAALAYRSPTNSSGVKRL